MLGVRSTTDGRVGVVKEHCEQSEPVRLSAAKGVVGLFISGFQLLGGCAGRQCLQMKMQEKEMFTLLDMTRREQGNC